MASWASGVGGLRVEVASLGPVGEGGGERDGE